MEACKKLTVLGDVMVEPSLLAASKRGETYDFRQTFEPLGGMLAQSDYVIANLETPLAGQAAGYTSCLVSFNTPDPLAAALKGVGVDLVLTANNHCLDRGLDGLRRTLDVLDDAGLAHTGTYRPGTRGADRIAQFSLGGTSVAAVSYTYGTNIGINHVCPEGADADCVNLLRPFAARGMRDPLPSAYKKVQAFAEQLAGRPISWEEGVLLKKAMEIPVAYADNVFDPADSAPYLARAAEDLRAARASAELVLFCPHIGGQFNTEPGAFSSYIVDQAVQMGFDAVLAAHSHTTQRAAYLGGTPCFYSLGNVTMSPSSIYSVRTSLPQYGAVCHLYLCGAVIERTTFSLVKMVEEDGRPLRVIPVEQLAQQLSGSALETLCSESAAVAARIAGRAVPEAIAPEYAL